jgi:two-component system chemotaxis response regulator CheB
MRKKIRVLIVDDSLVFREMLSRKLAVDTGIEVVGKASSSYEARDMIIELKPDVMTLDVEMPKMNGIEFLKKLMPQYPLPTVVVSSSPNRVFEALESGAVDFVEKPESGKLDFFISELMIKIKIAATARVGHYKIRNSRPVNTGALNAKFNRQVIAIGASTGGTKALNELLMKFHRNMPGIVVVQHMPEVFTKLFADRLNNDMAMEVKEAAHGDEVFPGRVLIAPGGKHMRVNKNSRGFFVELENETPTNKVSGHCPSVDVLFDSVADRVGNNAYGIILTGMGKDGAQGLLQMRQRGGRTIGQDKESCVVYGMPKVAYEVGAVEKQAPLSQIYDTLWSWLNQ